MFAFMRVMNARNLRRRPLRALLAIVTVAAGVSVIVAIVVELGSVREAQEQFSKRLAGPAPLRIVGPTTRGGIDPAVVERVREVPGVAAAVPVTRAITFVRTADGENLTVLALGVDCSFEQLVGSFGCAAGGAQGPPGTSAVTSARLAAELTPPAVLRTNSGALPLDGVRAMAELDDVNEGRMVFLPLPVALESFARQGRLDAVYILPEPGAPLGDVRVALATVAGPQYEVLEAADPPAGFDANSVLVPLLGIFALFSLGVGGLLVYQVATLSLTERRRDLAVAKALGAPPGLVAAGLLAEVAVLGVAGALLGVAGGIALAQPLVSSASQFTEQFLGLRVTPVVEPDAVGIGILVGLLTALGAAAVPIWRWSRSGLAGEISGRAARSEGRPARTWRRAAVLTAAGLAGIAATWVGSIGGGLAGWQPPVVRLGLLVATITLFAATGALAPTVLRALTGRRREAADRHDGRGPRGVAVRLAVTNLLGDPRRLSAMTIAVAVPVGMATVLAGLLISIRDASVDVTGVSADGRAIVTTTTFSDVGPVEAKLAPEALERLRALPEVAEVSRFAEVEVGYRSADLVYVEAYEQPTYPYKVLAGRLGDETIERGEVIVGASLARARGLRVGSDLELPTLEGPRSFRVGTVWSDPQAGGRTVLMPLALAERYFGDQPPGLVFARPAPGVSVDELTAAIAAAGLDPDLDVQTPAGYAEIVSDEVGALLAPLSALQRGLLIVSLIAVVSTLLLVGLQRRRELAALSALGVHPRMAVAMTVAEAVLCGVIGVVLGAVAAAGLFEALRQDAAIEIGMSPPFRYAAAAAAGYGLVAVALAVLGSLLPGWRAGRVPLAQVLRDE